MMARAPHRPAATPPTLAEVLRGSTVESVHRGMIAVADAAGTCLHAIGDVDHPIYPRSALKPIQALPLVETGALDGFGLGSEELALACASHRGEPMQVDRVSAWLGKVGLDASDLECGTHAPRDETAYRALISAGEIPSALHNNCSGKHAGFLTTARWLGEPTRGYIEREHPVQRRVIETAGALAGVDLGRAPWGRDGCGIPVLALPLQALATAMARLADPAGLPAARRGAAQRILAAMAAHPLLVDGSGGMTSQVMTVAGGTVRLKPGAEGVYAAALPTLGLGVALKIEDGAGRAAELAMITVLDRLGCFTATQRTALAAFLEPKIRTVAGRDAGALRATAALQL